MNQTREELASATRKPLFASQAAVKEIKCPICKAKPGEICKGGKPGTTPKQLLTPHRERMAKYRASLTKTEYVKRHRTMPL